MSRRVNKVKLLLDFMDSVESDEENGDFSSDDDLGDPNYEPDQINPEDERCISQLLRECETTDMFIAQAVNLSLNISALDTPAASSTMTVEEVPVVLEDDEEGVTVIEEIVSTTEAAIPSTSSVLPIQVNIQFASHIWLIVIFHVVISCCCFVLLQVYRQYRKMRSNFRKLPGANGQ